MRHASSSACKHNMCEMRIDLLPPAPLNMLPFLFKPRAGWRRLGILSVSHVSVRGSRSVTSLAVSENYIKYHIQYGDLGFLLTWLRALRSHHLECRLESFMSSYTSAKECLKNLLLSGQCFRPAFCHERRRYTSAMQSCFCDAPVRFCVCPVCLVRLGLRT